MLRFPFPRLSTCLLSALALAPPAAAGGGGDELEIHFLNVDQGSATLVVGPDGTTVLIDGGNPGDGNAIVVPYLNSLGISDLDYSFMTHWHTDHMGGMDEVFNAGFKPTTAYDRGNSSMPSNSQVTQYLNAASGVRATPPLGLTIALGDGATLQVVGLNGSTLGGSADPASGMQFENASSIGGVVRYGDFDFFFAGDMTGGGNGTANVEGLATSAVGQVEVAQSSHHGSNTSSPASVVANLDPSFVVHSCGLDNPFFHPTKTVTKTWSTPLATRVQWCTTEGKLDNDAGGFAVANGHIQLTTDGTRFTVGRSSGPEELTFTTFENPGSPPIGSSLVVGELLVNPFATSDDNGEWFELVNVSEADTVDLGGVQVSSGSDTFIFKSRLLLEHGERVVIGLNGRPSLNGNVFIGAGAPWEDFGMSNSSSSLIVRAPNSSVLDSVNWGAGGFAVVAGSSAERKDLLAATSPSNFATATSTWAGGDKGSPGEEYLFDVTPWPAVLVADPPPRIGEALTLKLYSKDEPNSFYYLGMSTGFYFGPTILIFEFPVLIDFTTPLFKLFAADPQAFSTLQSGQREICLDLPANPSLVGIPVYSNFVTLQFIFPSIFLGSKQSNLEFVTIQP